MSFFSFSIFWILPKGVDQPVEQYKKYNFYYVDKEIKGIDTNSSFKREINRILHGQF
jgi:hypothetical protein